MCPNYVIPINISVKQWSGTSLTILPIFKQSQHRKNPVNRCHNCRETYGLYFNISILFLLYLSKVQDLAILDIQVFMKYVLTK